MARGEKLGFTQTPTIKATDLEAGDEINGQFIGIKQVATKKYDRPMLLIRLEDKNGKEFALRANSAIEQQVDQLQEGQIYVFVALGEQKNPKTGRDFHAFEIYPGDADELTFDIDEAIVEEELAPKPEPKKRVLAGARK